MWCQGPPPPPPPPPACSAVGWMWDDHQYSLVPKTFFKICYKIHHYLERKVSKITVF
jgi:hypothetical protein